MWFIVLSLYWCFFFPSRSRHTRCALVSGVQTCALPVCAPDLVATHPSLMRIPDAIVLARRTRKIIRQNLTWALGYNVLALPLATAGLVTPWLAALGMAASSLAVTVNALQIGRAHV